MQLTMADPALKLFGRTIQLADIGSSSGSDLNPSRKNKDTPTETEQNNTSTNEDPDQEKGEDPEQKALKKPDKILPCPRCNSLDTKFCYYNNYNVNQPRYFCKNCHRYWTSGGTIRNVPVGAGRRKNKHSVPHFRPVLLPPSPAALSFSDEDALNDQMSKADITTATTIDQPVAPPVVVPPLYYPAPPWAFSWGVPVVLGPFWHVPCVPVALGKHARDGTVIAPKTLRIDDPDEAARSSIWSTLGIDGGMFKGCKAKSKGGEAAPLPSFVVNPAAFSRSCSFQEGV